MRAMPPKLVSDDGRNVVIRPLLYAAEKSIARYAELVGFPILPCDLCGSQEQLMRKQVKRLLADLEALAPRARESMLAAMGNVRPSQLLDKGLWQSLGLAVAQDSGARPDGARAEDARPDGTRADDAQAGTKSEVLVAEPLRLGRDKRLPLLKLAD
jgi:tRNA 2-thiocytidine biosynthesis protein TtcA